MFSTVMIDVANEFGVPTYVFYTSATAALGFHLHMQRITTDDLRGCERDLNIPTYAKPFPPSSIPYALLDKHGFAMFLAISKLISATKGVIVNTFLELESHPIKTISHDPNSPPLYPVGPILNLAGAGQSSQQILEWLDDQPEGSVVFLFFGILALQNSHAEPAEPGYTILEFGPEYKRRFCPSNYRLNEGLSFSSEI
ncbi:PREDICTED: anthocyanidin 3-O-glucosyltransferase 1-like [Ipomoea nil]|uniref:anthocyanidin 3-O-glucosyltransferase 1-like n=1 Tax=Ipomoea nil TaxID=35883 RepID=UPI000900F32B|nr:PREDICTED: anthocyanidin 3-O-glucosyltransferase 1-like [Ipomoea nil]